jgi:hypothetical protein
MYIRVSWREGCFVQRAAFLCSTLDYAAALEPLFRPRGQLLIAQIKFVRLPPPLHPHTHARAFNLKEIVSITHNTKVEQGCRLLCFKGNAVKGIEKTKCEAFGAEIGPFSEWRGARYLSCGKTKRFGTLDEKSFCILWVLSSECFIPAKS